MTATEREARSRSKQQEAHASTIEYPKEPPFGGVAAAGFTAFLFRTEPRFTGIAPDRPRDGKANGIRLFYRRGLGFDSTGHGERFYCRSRNDRRGGDGRGDCDAWCRDPGPASHCSGRRNGVANKHRSMPGGVRPERKRAPEDEQVYGKPAQPEFTDRSLQSASFD